mgnify:CR=1 FL=1
MEINKIYKGDSIEVLKMLPSESIDFIFADPPYYMQTEGELLRTDGTKFNGVEDEWDKFESFQDYDNFTKQWLGECRRVLKKNGTIAVIGSFQNIYRVGNIMQDLGYWILNDIIWKKTNPVPNFSGKRFCNAHETILWCSKDKKSKITFNYKTMKFLNGDKQEKSVWEIPLCTGNERLKDEDGNKLHSTQKPEKLLYKILISMTKPKDVVLDPFFGTGTTGAVAIETGRNYIGIEREEKYIEGAKIRINAKKVIIDKISNLELETKPPKVPMKKLLENGYIQKDLVTKNISLINKYKVCTAKAYGERGDLPYMVLAKPFIAEPNSCCSETYIVLGAFDTKRESQNLVSYIKTKFFRFLVLLIKNTQDASQRVYSFVPLQDFSKPWTDAELYEKYGLTDEEIAFIESMIKPMELGDDD